MAHGDMSSRAPSSPSSSSASAPASAASSSVYASDLLQRRNHADATVAVVGAGFLGRCIALDLSLLGVRVLVCDSDPQAAAALPAFAFELMTPMLHLGYVTKSMITRACSGIRVVRELRDCASAGVVIEAIPDDLEAKVKLFQTLETLCSASTVLATSTVELSIDAIQQRLMRPDRVLGVRFFHPCLLLPPVEVTLGSQTSDSTLQRVVAWLTLLQKQPHRGPTRRVLSNREVSAFQFNTAVRGGFYHGLLAATPQSTSGIIVPADGPPLVEGGDDGSRGYTTAL